MAVFLYWDTSSYGAKRPVRRFTMPGNGERDIRTDYATVNNLVARRWIASREFFGAGMAFSITREEETEYWPNDTKAGETLNEVQLVISFVGFNWGVNDEHFSELQLYVQEVQGFLLKCQGLGAKEKEDEVLEALLNWTENHAPSQRFDPEEFE